MKLTDPEVQHIQVLIEELLFRLKDDEQFLISDLEDQIKIVAEIVGVNPNVEQDDREPYDY